MMRSARQREQQFMSRLVFSLQSSSVLGGARRQAGLLFDGWRERWLRRVLNRRYRSQPGFPAVACHGNPADSEESAVLKSCFASALSKSTRLPPEICTIQDMSGQKYRSFINQLLASIPHPRYLEVGSWAGSTATA